MPYPPSMCQSIEEMPFRRYTLRVYHERQSLFQCARHTVNNLLQEPAYSSADFERLARALDRWEIFPETGGQNRPREHPATAETEEKGGEVLTARHNGERADGRFVNDAQSCLEGESVAESDAEKASRGDHSCVDTERVYQISKQQFLPQTAEHENQNDTCLTMSLERENGASASEQNMRCAHTEQLSPVLPFSSPQNKHAHLGKEACFSPAESPLRENSDSSSTSLCTAEQDTDHTRYPSCPNRSTEPLAPAHISWNTDFFPSTPKRANITSCAAAPLSSSSVSCAAGTPVPPRPVQRRPLVSPILPEEGLRTNLFSSLFGTNYSAPFGLGNYDLSLVQLLLGRHGLELDFRNERRAQDTTSKTVSTSKDRPEKDSSLRQERMHNRGRPIISGGVTLEQLRNPRLVGFIINVELPKTGWRRLLPKSASRHFYAVRKLRCTYTSESRSSGAGRNCETANEMKSRGQAGVVLLLGAADPRGADVETRESQTATPAVTCAHCGEAPHESACASLSGIQHTKGGTEQDAASHFPLDNERHTSSHSLSAAESPHSERGYCWVNLDSKLERPQVFVDDRALALYLNKKLGEGDGFSIGEDTQAKPWFISGEKERCRGTRNERCVSKSTPRAVSQNLERAESPARHLGAKRLQTDKTREVLKDTREEHAIVHGVQWYSRHGTGSLHMYMPSRYGNEDLPVEACGFDDDGYKDAIVIEVLTTDGGDI
uniref:ubiquitinyl hydrolase 1 n=1 Tax=Toxoplasma gondii (strain ATCC 50861 / VEG) TaxID=432359 RepID=A0A0F7V9B3_TOXGV|nr:TPA: hypothetical protein BN1205_064305 [Toxoplasma gondii VEG]